MKLCSWDMETWLDTDIHPEYGYMGRPPLPVCASFHMEKKKPTLKTAADSKNMIKALLLNPDVTIIGQNVAFDLSAAIKWLGVPAELVYREHHAGRIKDTMVRELLIAICTGDILNRGKSYSLAQLTLDYLGEDKFALKSGEDVWRLKYRELDGVPIDEYPKEAYDYALGDAVDTLKIYKKQAKIIRRLGLSTPEEEFQTLSNFTCWKVGEMSPFVNGDSTQAFKKKHKKVVDKIQAPFAEAGFLRVNKNRFPQYDKGDPKRIGFSENKSVFQDAVVKDYKAQGQIVPMTEASKKFPQGQVKTDQETLMGCTSKALRKYGEAAQDIKLVNAYVPMLEKFSGRRVLPMYNVLLATARISCRKPSMQVLPRAPGARECFEPPEGYAIVCLDYDSMEMFGQAQHLYWTYGEHKLLDALNDSLDPHILVTSEILGTTYKAALLEYKAGNEFVETVRQLSKIINFGAVGGMGWETFLRNMPDNVRDVMRTLEPGKSLKVIMQNILHTWRDTWHMHQHFSDVSRQTSKGRKFDFVHPWKGRKRGRIGYCDGCNLPMQSLCADAYKHQANTVMEEIMIPGTYLNEKGVELGALLHDEDLMMIPVEHVRKCATRVQTIMIEKGQEVMPDCKLRVGIEVTGENWKKKGVSIDVYEDLQSKGLTVAEYFKQQKKDE